MECMNHILKILNTRKVIFYFLTIGTLSIQTTLPGTANATSNFTKELICKAGIATIMGRNPSIIRIERSEGEIVYLSYRRPDDGTRWAQKCKIEKNRIIWASNNPGSTGRWRTHELDEKIYFNITNNGWTLQIEERHYDGSSTTNQFSLKQLSK